MKPKLLVIDDQVMYGRSLERTLRKDYDVCIASTCGEARRNSDNADIVLVDICLSESDTSNREGLDFIRWLHAEFPKISIIAMSALQEEDIENDAKEAGATHFLHKPIILSQLRSLLTDLANRYKR